MFYYRLKKITILPGLSHPFIDGCVRRVSKRLLRNRSQRVKIRDVATFVRGVSYTKDQARKECSEGSVAVLRANNISAGNIIMSDLVFVPDTLVTKNQIVGKGDIVITMSSGSNPDCKEECIIELLSSVGRYKRYQDFRGHLNMKDSEEENHA